MNDQLQSEAKKFDPPLDFYLLIVSIILGWFAVEIDLYRNHPLDVDDFVLISILCLVWVMHDIRIRWYSIVGLCILFGGFCLVSGIILVEQSEHLANPLIRLAGALIGLLSALLAMFVKWILKRFGITSATQENQ